MAPVLGSAGMLRKALVFPALRKSAGPAILTSVLHPCQVESRRGSKKWWPDEEYWKQYESGVCYPHKPRWYYPEERNFSVAPEKLVRNFVINFGPQHPAAHGVLRLILELEGEKVLRADPHIGLLHRATEKLIEYKTYTQALPYFDRLDYVSMMVNEQCFSLAIEKMLNIDIPKRAKYIRGMRLICLRSWIKILTC